MENVMNMRENGRLLQIKYGRKKRIERAAVKAVNREMKKNRAVRENKKKWISLFLAVLLIFSLWIYRESLEEIWDGIRQAAGRELAAAAALAGLGYLLEGMTITAMMQTVVPAALAKRGVWIAFVCEFYRLTTLGNGSGLAEIHYLHESGIEPAGATVLTMIQYMIKRTAIILFAIFAFRYLTRKEETRELCREYAVFMGIGCTITCIILLFFLCLVLSCRVAEGTVWILEKLEKRFPALEQSCRKWEEQILLLNRCGKSVLRQKAKLTEALIFQIGKLALFYSVPAYLLTGKTTLTAGESMMLMALCYMLSGVIPAPSGAGSLEFVFLLFFTSFGGAEAAVPAILIFRFVTWICPALAGAVLLVCKKCHRRIDDETLIP